MVLELRQYQKDCLNTMYKYFIKNDKSIGLVTAATGLGKTILSNAFSDYLLREKGYKKIMMVAHRDELINQNMDKMIRNFYPNELNGFGNVCGIIKRDTWEIDRKFISSSIQTLYSRKDKDLLLFEDNKIDFLIIDEAHHVDSDNSYMEVINILRNFNPKMKILGLTATPFRTKNDNLKDIFGELVYSIDIKEGIRQGYLSPIKGKRIILPINLEGCKRSRGDIQVGGENGLEKLIDNDNIYDLVVDRWKEFAFDRKTIFYTSAVMNSVKLAKKFQDNNINCIHLDANTPLIERRKILEDFKNNKVQILSNVGILTEGYDCIDIECISMLRPTESLGFYVQCVGRGLRISPLTGKKDCLVLDFTTNSKKFNIINLPMLFGIDMKNVNDFSIGSKIKEDGEKEERKLQISLGDVEEVEDFDYEGKGIIDYITFLNNRDIRVLNCGFNDTIILMTKSDLIDKNDLDLWNIEIIKNEKGRKIEVKEKFKNIPEDYGISLMITKWINYKDKRINDILFDRMNDNHPTDKQLNMIRNFVRDKLVIIDNIKNLTRLDASNILGYCFYMKNNGFDTDKLEPTPNQMWHLRKLHCQGIQGIVGNLNNINRGQAKIYLNKYIFNKNS